MYLWLVIAYLTYVFLIHPVMTYEDLGWGLGARFLHTLWRGWCLLFFIYAVIRAFQDLGVIPRV